jgi:ribosomal protein S18 acetylase RimI-like enzyme
MRSTQIHFKLTNSKMPDIQYREAKESDIPEMARIRSKNWGTEEYWNTRISGYVNYQLHPQQALIPRIIFIASETGMVVGFIAGHLTRRYDCDGELEWIDTIPEYMRSGIAGELLRLLATWFIDRRALRICVDSDPNNLIARQFYKKYGAEDLNKHWLLWKNVSNILEK